MLERNVLDILEELETAPQGNGRLDVLKKNDNRTLREVLEQALSPDITFGIKDLPKYEDQGECYGSGISWNFHLQQLLRRLRTRELSGNAAHEAVAHFFKRCDSLEAKWAERIIRQDLRVNIGAKEVNKALPGTIYLFEVPLATDFTKVKPKDLQGEWVIEPKLDGGRCVAVCPGEGGPVRLLSRTGKEWKNFESIRTVLQAWNDSRTADKNILQPTYYLDGEVVSLDEGGRIDFQQIQKTMLRKDGIEVGKLQYVVFDVADEDEWKRPQRQYRDRLCDAVTIVKTIGSDRVGIINISFEKDLTDTCLRSWANQMVELGYEGAMARRSDLPVENKRSKRLLKAKTFADMEVKVVGRVEGTGKYSGSLGALQCLTDKGLAFEVGSGFDDRQRKEIWKTEKLPQWASIKYFEITDAGVPRFPIFRWFRHEADF